MDVFDERACQLGEGPYYDDRSGRAEWVDILGCAVMWRELATGASGAWSTAGHVGAAVPRETGGWVLCLPAGPVLVDPDGQQKHLGTFAEADAAAGQPPSAQAPARRANDAKADPAGRLWLGTMAYDETPGAGALYRLDLGARAPVQVLAGVTVSNGLGWSPDGQLMYYIDTASGQIDVFDTDPATGALAGRRQFAAIDRSDGHPDGLCVDAAGGVWVALWGGGALRRYAPDGVLDRVVQVPTPLVTSCAFVGPQLDQLLITTARLERTDPAAGRTYQHHPEGVSGLPVHRFAG